MSDKAAKVMQRYQAGYVTDSQLVRYRELGAITQAEYDTIYALRYPDPEPPIVQEPEQIS